MSVNLPYDPWKSGNQPQSNLSGSNPRSIWRTEERQQRKSHAIDKMFLLEGATELVPGACGPDVHVTSGGHYFTTLSPLSSYLEPYRLDKCRQQVLADGTGWNGLSWGASSHSVLSGCPNAIQIKSPETYDQQGLRLSSSVGIEEIPLIGCTYRARFLFGTRDVLRAVFLNRKAEGTLKRDYLVLGALLAQAYGVPYELSDGKIESKEWVYERLTIKLSHIAWKREQFYFVSLQYFHEWPEQ